MPVLAGLGTLVQAIRLGGVLNYHEDFSSILMAVGFALGMSAYVALLYRTGIATLVPEL